MPSSPRQDPEIATHVVRADASAQEVESARILMREYASMPHITGRWCSIDEDIAALPQPFVAPAGVLLVARRNGMDVGCGALREWSPGIGELKRMYVRPDARGLGVGSALLTSLLAHARTLGFTRVRLDTAPELHSAIAMYTRHAFMPIPSYHQSQCMDALYFERVLDDAPSS